jgi:hypothetical protein
LLTTGVYSIHMIYWSCDLSKIKLSDVPGVSSKWIREYSLSPDTDFKYNYSNNSVIDMNNTYYLSTSGLSNSTLDNKITIYINKNGKTY